MPAGAPPFFKTPEEMEEAIEEYFKAPVMSIEYIDAPPTKTISGLAYHLGFESRQSFYDYEKRAEFSYIVKRARLRIETLYEEKISGKNPAGPIFALKNMGWTDKQEIDHTTQGEKMVFGGVQIIRPDEEVHPPAE